MDTSAARLHARAVFAGAVATYFFTAVHHVYGAIIYDTPWRHHAAVVGVGGAVVLAVARATWSRAPTSMRGRVALAVFALCAALHVVLAIGVFEGLYNHVIKNLLFFGGLPLDLHHRLFPPPTYEVPNDVIFEVTGILQVVPAGYATLGLARLLRVCGVLCGRAPAAEVRTM